MIPHIIHYCWFGRGPMPQETLDCIASWHKFMPDWKYRLWNEENFDINCCNYTREAYAAKKYAFVSDYVRLDVLNKEGGVYLDTDVMVLKSFEDLMWHNAFCGFEGSKAKPIGTNVMATVPDGEWIREMFNSYTERHFLNCDGSLDMTTNTSFLSAIMEKDGFIRNGKLQTYKDCLIFPTEYFSPRQTTGEYFLTTNTYSDHLGAASWSDSKDKYFWLRKLIGQKNMTRLIKIKRKLIN